MKAGVLPGLRIGHASDHDAGTGCTVLLGPFRASCRITGFATGTRELDALAPEHLVPRIDALLLTGGSAFGLAAADGVVAWLEERGHGFETGFAKVPIVPAAVIYDLGTRRADRRPDAAMGRAACEDARPDNTAHGRVGAGTGATVGKLLGRERSSPGGLGLGLTHGAAHTVMAVAVVNAFGDVLGSDGRVIAGARTEDGTGFVDALTLLLAGAVPAGRMPPPVTNTTLAAVVTDAPLSRVDLHRLAQMAGTALARRISPVNTPFDGDVVFALSTAAEERALEPAELLAVGAAAIRALETAIEHAVLR